MSRTAAMLLGAYLGAVLGFLVSIGYDTSSNVSTLEGGQAHFRFVGVLLIAGVFAVFGLIGGEIVHSRGRRRARPRREVHLANFPVTPFAVSRPARRGCGR